MKTIMLLNMLLSAGLTQLQDCCCCCRDLVLTTPTWTCEEAKANPIPSCPIPDEERVCDESDCRHCGDEPACGERGLTVEEPGLVPAWVAAGLGGAPLRVELYSLMLTYPAEPELPEAAEAWLRGRGYGFWRVTGDGVDTVIALGIDPACGGFTVWGLAPGSAAIDDWPELRARLRREALRLYVERHLGVR